MKNSVTVLSIVPAPLLPAVSGGQKGTYGLLDALGRICKLVCIADTLSPAAGHSFELRPLIVHNFTKYFSIRNFKLLNKEITAINPSFIILEQPYMGIIVTLLSRKHQVPFFIHAHNIEFLRFKSLGKWWWPMLYIWEKFVFRKAKGIYFVSDQDRQLAIKHLNTDEHKCFVSAHGVPHNSPIELTPEKIAKIRARHKISPDETVFMFFGVLKYLPNLEALEILISKVLPILKELYHKPYKVLVCGGGLNQSFKEYIAKLDDPNLIYTGFVENIDEYTQSADVILNPILNGGGVKTKVIEALSFNKPVVSTTTGATGIIREVCNDMLYLAPDDDWREFTVKMIEASENKKQIGKEFFNYYHWDALAQKAFDQAQSLLK